jgi:hypothetical protein
LISQVASITTDSGQMRAHHLSIECVNTINQGLLLHHAKRGCPNQPKSQYVDFLLGGLDQSIESSADMTTLKGQEKLSSEQQVEPNKYGSNAGRHPQIHTLFSTECNDYFDWQTLGLYHSYLLSGQPGRITRLLSCTDEQLKYYANIDVAPTHVVPSYSVHPLTGDRYGL